MEMACVTGKEADAERRTPSGVFSVLDKVRDTILGSLEAPDPGQRYESHVDVWMPFYESYGLHDASWRENFGGSWYYQYGSHGCVNLPPSEARALFDAIEIFTPVIVLREGDNAPEGTKRGDTTWNPPDGGIYYADDYN
jgi:lipoprotein-anchoring transpeptidase ErfK/SrfK